MKLLKSFRLRAVKSLAKQPCTDVIDTDAIFRAALMEDLNIIQEFIEFEYTTENVPESGKAIFAMYKDAIAGADSFRVFSGANLAEDLYFTPATNLAYRALHDIDHATAYAQGRGTTKREDELYLNCLMAKRAYSHALNAGYGHKAALLTFFHVYHDTVGQVHYYFKHNEFCVNQKALTTQLINDCIGVKAVLADNYMVASIVMQDYLKQCNVDFKLI